MSDINKLPVLRDKNGTKIEEGDCFLLRTRLAGSSLPSLFLCYRITSLVEKKAVLRRLWEEFEEVVPLPNTTFINILSKDSVVIPRNIVELGNEAIIGLVKLARSSNGN